MSRGVDPRSPCSQASAVELELVVLPDRSTPATSVNVTPAETGRRHVWWCPRRRSSTLGATCPPRPHSRLPRRRKDPDPLAKSFGDAVRTRRLKLGLTLDQLGDRMGRTDGRHIAEIERGYHVTSLAMARELADALETKLTELVKDL